MVWQVLQSSARGARHVSCAGTATPATLATPQRPQHRCRLTCRATTIRTSATCGSPSGASQTLATQPTTMHSALPPTPSRYVSWQAPPVSEGMLALCHLQIILMDICLALISLAYVHSQGCPEHRASRASAWLGVRPTPDSDPCQSPDDFCCLQAAFMEHANAL